jgi:hypothetical protein
MWRDDRLVVVEDVPARICEACQEQYYDEETSAGILRLVNAGFPQHEAVREITVPVFSLDAPDDWPDGARGEGGVERR